MEKDLYEILRVRYDATQEEIKEAYKKLSKKYHPDTGGTNEQMAELNYAYSVLSDPVKKDLYDKKNNFNNTDDTVEEWPWEEQFRVIHVITFDNAKGYTVKNVLGRNLDFDYTPFIDEDDNIYVYEGKVMQKNKWLEIYYSYLKTKTFDVKVLTRWSLKPKHYRIPASNLPDNFYNYVHTDGNLYMYHDLNKSATATLMYYPEWNRKLNRRKNMLHMAAIAVLMAAIIPFWYYHPFTETKIDYYIDQYDLDDIEPTAYIDYEVYPERDEDFKNIYFESADKNIATCDGTKIIGVSTGETAVYAYVDGKKTDYKIDVSVVLYPCDKIEYPPSGVLDKDYDVNEHTAPFTVTSNKYATVVKLVNIDTNKTVQTIFVNKNETVKSNVPNGAYMIYTAFGTDFYSDYTFGYTGIYKKSDEIFYFEYDRKKYTRCGNELILNTFDGNMDFDSTNKEDFTNLGMNN